MNKKAIIIALALSLVACTSANAQNILGRLAERAKNAAENAVGNKIENAVTGAIDKAASKKGKNDKGAKQNSSNEDAVEEGYTNASVETVKSDFVQGPVVLFEDDFAGEQIGEFPSRWEVDYGDIQIARIAGRLVPKFDGEGKIYPLMKKDQENYLPDVFTLEWDMYFAGRGTDGEIFAFDIRFDGKEKRSSSRIWYYPDGGYGISWDCSKPGEGTTDGRAEDEKANFKRGEWNHFAVSFNKRAFKIYVNGVRVANVPNMAAPSNFKFEYVNSRNYPYCCISNVRLGQGAVDLYARNASDLTAVEKSMQETGKFVTNNILFETGKATLKPESMADIQSVADYMKKNPSVRFEVQGHCDNQGSDKINDPLSQQRAEAIVTELVKLGVDEWNLRAVGKGSHEPVADNSTEAGRAQNRRVEFIKK